MSFNPSSPVPSPRGFARRALEVLMSGKVKVAVAIAILVALGSVVGYDLMRAKRTSDTASTPDASGLVAIPENAPECSTPDLERALRDLERGGSITSGSVPAPTAAPTTAPAPAPTLPGPEFAAPAEEYTVQSGERLCDIAEKKYGDANLWTLIANANPKVNPSRMRVGQKLVIPTRGAGVETVSAEPAVENGVKTYQVRPGDDLGKIAKRLYGSNSAEIRRRIHEANPDAFDSTGDHLEVGVKLVLPEIASRPAPRVAAGEPGSDHTTRSVDPATAGGRTHTVVSGDSLWSLAKKYKGSRSLNAFLGEIVSANPDKLKSSSTALRAGWVLAIPE